VLDSTNQKETPLMLAANNGYLNVVRYLVEHTEAGEIFDLARMRADKAKADAEAAEAAEEKAREEEEAGGNDNEEANEDGEEHHDDEDEHNKNINLSEDSETRRQKEAADVEEAFRKEHEEKQFEVMGLEQKNARGWTALIGAAHYGQLYVVHYLVSKGADPDIKDEAGHTARNIPMSLLAHSRHGTPVVQPQILAAIDKGIADRNKPADRNIKRAAVEKSLIRFKRAERFMIDGEVSRRIGQFETASLLFGYARDETRANKLVKEETELRNKAKALTEQMTAAHQKLVADRTKAIRDALQAEAQRNYFLAERYIQGKSYQAAIQCLVVCLQYEPLNDTYQKTLVTARQLQNAKREPITVPVVVAKNEGEEGQEKKQVEEVKAPRTCSLFGFSFF